MDAYADQLEVYRDEKIKEGIGKGLNERELIASMYALIFYMRKLDRKWIEFYVNREFNFQEGGEELKILNSEFRLADTNIDGKEWKYVWRNPDVYEFFLQSRKIARSHRNYGLISSLGMAALNRHPFSEIEGKYRASYLD